MSRSSCCFWLIDPTLPFRGTFAIAEILSGAPPLSFWNAPGITSPQARHLFSLATCNGCHVCETNTHFRHLPGPSGFLTGIDVVDPVVPSTVRHFEDLTRRAHSLAELGGAACSGNLRDRLAGFGAGFAQRIGEVNLPIPPITNFPLLAPH